MGVLLATRFNLYYPRRVLENIWTSVAYFPRSSIKFSLAANNSLFKRTYGFQPFVYVLYSRSKKQKDEQRLFSHVHPHALS